MKNRLVEAARTVSDAESSGLALFRWKEYDSTYSYCLFDADTLYGRIAAVVDATGLRSGSYFSTAYVRAESTLPSVVYGYIEVSPDQDTGGAEVYASCAQKGWGPLMYQIAMSEMGALYPDRESVSPSARAVWDHFSQDPSLKQTKIPGWDDVMYSGIQLDVSGLYSAGEHIMTQIESDLGVDTRAFTKLIERVATDYFDRRYRGGLSS